MHKRSPLLLTFANLDVPLDLNICAGVGLGCTPSNTRLDNKPGKFAFESENNRCQDILRLHQPEQNLLPAAARCSRASSAEPCSSLAAGLIKMAFLYLKEEMKSRTYFRRVNTFCLLFYKIPGKNPTDRCLLLRKLPRVRVKHAAGTTAQPCGRNGGSEQSRRAASKPSTHFCHVSWSWLTVPQRYNSPLKYLLQPVQGQTCLGSSLWIWVYWQEG